MSVKRLLEDYSGRIYVYLANDKIGKQFLQDAQNDGFTFCDATAPTQRTPATVMAVNRDFTINYVGFVGHIAYQSASKIGNESLVKIDYRDFCD